MAVKTRFASQLFVPACTDLICCLGEENGPGLSISDIREAVEKTLTRDQWLSFEGDEKEPIPSLSSLLNTTWDYLQTQLGKALCDKRAIYNRLGNPDITIIRPNRSENIRNGRTYFSLGARPPVRLACGCCRGPTIHKAATNIGNEDPHVLLHLCGHL